MTNPHTCTHPFIATPMRAHSVPPIDPPYPPSNIFLFHRKLACFCRVVFRFSSLFRVKPTQQRRRAFGYDGCHASSLRR
jgi:hypothetical protein